MLEFLRRRRDKLEDLPGPDPWAEFRAIIASAPRKAVLEAGTAQAVPGRSTLPPSLLKPKLMKAWNTEFPSWAIVNLVARKHG